MGYQLCAPFALQYDRTILTLFPMGLLQQPDIILTSVKFYFFDTQMWNKVSVMTLIRLRWRATTYMVSYHNNRSWRILHTTGGNQQARKVDTNNFTMFVSSYFLRSHNCVITYHQWTIEYHLESCVNRVSWWFVQWYVYSFNACTLYKSLVHILYFYFIII